MSLRECSRGKVSALGVLREVGAKAVLVLRDYCLGEFRFLIVTEAVFVIALHMSHEIAF